MNEIDAFQYALIVRGPLHNQRKLCMFDKTYSAYAELGPEVKTTETYLSPFTYDEAMVTHIESTGATAGFDGPVAFPYVHFDFDAEDLNAALRDATGLITLLVDRYEIKEQVIQVWFSGRRGVHVLLPATGLPVNPGPIAHQMLKELALRLADEAGVAPDPTVYNKTRLFRAPNTQHPESGLYKVHFRVDELLGGLQAKQVLEKAREPYPADILTLEEVETYACGSLAPLAQKCVDSTRQRHEMQAMQYQSGGSWPTGRKLSKATLDYIRFGHQWNDGRKMGLFKAAANLAECGCPENVIRMLLEPSGRDSGLAPGVVKKQIDDGTKKGKMNE